MSRLTAVLEPVESTTMTVSPYRTMLPPIWVAACESQRRRNPAFRKTARALVGRLRCRSVSAVTRLGSVAGRRERGAQVRIASLDEGRRAAAPAAVARGGRGGRSPGSAGRCPRRDGRPATCPCRTGGRAEAGRRRPRTAEGLQIGASGGSGYQSRGWPWTGTSVRSVAGSSSRSIGVTVMTTSGWVAASCAMTPPDRVSEPVSCSDAPMASSVNVSARSAPSRLAAPGGPTATTPGTSRTPPRRHRLGARVAELVDQVLEARAVDRAADRDRHAGTGDRVQARVGADAPEVGADLVDRGLAAVLVRGERGRVRARATRSPARSWSLRWLTLATKTVRSCVSSAASPAPPACARSWTTTSRPSTKATAAIVSWLRRTCIAVSPAGSRPGRPGRRRRQ